MVKSMSHLPNGITVLRILLIPVFIAVFYLPMSMAHQSAALIFAVASFTDWLDGFLARKMHLTSSFGSFLDPVADKLLVATCLLLLVGSKDMYGITLPAIIIVGREIVISSLREWMAELGKRTSIAVNYLGKIKTLLQMVALVLLLLFRPDDSYWGFFGFVLLYISSFLTLWSMVVYLSIAWPEFYPKNHSASP